MELDQLEPALYESQLVRHSDRLWWLVRCTTWRPVCALLADHGTPSREILEDWGYQLAKRPGSPCDTLVSPTGLLVSLHSYVDSLRDRFTARSDFSTEDWMSYFGSREGRECQRTQWPETQGPEFGRDQEPAVGTHPPSAQPDTKPNPVLQAVAAANALAPRTKASVAQRPEARRASSHLRQRKTIAACFCALAATLIIIALATAFLDREAPGTIQSTTIQSTREEVISTPAPLASTEIVDPGELATTPLDDLAIPQPDFDQLLDSLGLSTADRSTLATARLTIAQSENQVGHEQTNSDALHGGLDLDSILKQSLGEGRAALEPVGTPEPMSMADDDAMKDEDDGTDPLEVPNRVSKLEIDFAKGPSRTEFKMGRGVVVRNSVCTATLSLEGQGEDEIQDAWIVEPKEIQSAQGNGLCEWRVAQEDTDPELLVQLLSRAGNRWLLITRVGVRMAPGEPPVLVTANDVALVLQRLGTYQRWLSDSIERLRNSPRPPRSRGMPDIGIQVRWLQAQQRDAEKAIKQWSEVAKLCDTLYARGKLTIELSVSPPTP